MKVTSNLTRTLRRCLGALLCAAATMAGAQTFPDKPVRIVVAAPPGGTLDVVARILAEALQPALGQPVIVDNKAGGVGMVGVQELLSAPHDGHTVMVHISGIVSEIPHLAKPRYDPFKDIKPIAELTRSGLVFIGGPQLQAHTLKDVVGWVKANPGKVNYASYTTGTIGHTSGAEFNALAKLDMSHVGYKGSAPALQDVMGGHVPLMFDGAATSVPLIKAGRVKAFAVTNPQRLPALPNVPTFAELGYPEMTQEAWVGLWVTPDVPAPVQAKLRELALKALQQPKVRERIVDLGMEVGKPSTSDDMAKSLRVAFDRQAALLKSINFKPE
jgi:tripartite-type tricarboxylate transporter receptor subunit TctC